MRSGRLRLLLKKRISIRSKFCELLDRSENQNEEHGAFGEILDGIDDSSVTLIRLNIFQESYDDENYECKIEPEDVKGITKLENESDKKNCCLI